MVAANGFAMNKLCSICLLVGVLVDPRMRHIYLLCVAFEPLNNALMVDCDVSYPIDDDDDILYICMCVGVYLGQKEKVACGAHGK